MRFFIFLFFPFVMLSGCFFDTHIPEKTSVRPLYSEFVKPGTFSPDYQSLKEAFDRRFRCDDLTWDKEKNVFYVVYSDSNEFIFSLSSSRNEAEIYKLYSIEGEGPDVRDVVSFRNCMEKNIKEDLSKVYDLCKKERTVPQSLIEKMELFLNEDKLSVVSHYFHCFGSLHLFFYDGDKYHYFDMDNPSCLDENIKKDPRIPEYIEFYSEMAAFIKQDFSECRWDNFGNREKIISECGKFNWRWKEKYPDLVE